MYGTPCGRRAPEREPPVQRKVEAEREGPAPSTRNDIVAVNPVLTKKKLAEQQRVIRNVRATVRRQKARVESLLVKTDLHAGEKASGIFLSGATKVREMEGIDEAQRLFWVSMLT
mmetsp:Transcript_40545/g.126812  ORF Transcript_40545/g.126812 Transcript_40545/m.126812 type:complete len:115 (-) Transcript_40545:218-562(-)